MSRILSILLAAMAVLAAGAGPAHAAAPAPAADAKDIGTGGLAALSAEEVQALREARQVVREIADDEAEEEEARVQAIRAFTRINEALAGWGNPALLAWYLDMLARAQSPRIQEALVIGGQAAAKGGAYHLGGVREFWRQVDAQARAKPLGDPAERVRREFQRIAGELGKPRKAAPDVKPLVLQPVKLNLKNALQPYPEEKKPAK
jgi:hypothetical protein